MPKRSYSLEFLHNIRTTTECVEWPYSRNKLGYGSLMVKGKSWLAHRLAYNIHIGVLPLLLRHTCDNPSCVNPKHLVSGTTQDNMDDMVSRGRSCGGERRSTKLTEENVRYIRDNYIRGCGKRIGNSAVLAARFSICSSHVLRIVRRDKWNCAT